MAVEKLLFAKKGGGAGVEPLPWSTNQCLTVQTTCTIRALNYNRLDSVIMGAAGSVRRTAPSSLQAEIERLRERELDLMVSRLERFAETSPCISLRIYRSRLPQNRSV